MFEGKVLMKNEVVLFLENFISTVKKIFKIVCSPFTVHRMQPTTNQPPTTTSQQRALDHPAQDEW
jgi:hypothetical protein